MADICECECKWMSVSVLLLGSYPDGTLLLPKGTQGQHSWCKCSAAAWDAVGPGQKAQAGAGWLRLGPCHLSIHYIYIENWQWKWFCQSDGIAWWTKIWWYFSRFINTSVFTRFPTLTTELQPQSMTKPDLQRFKELHFILWKSRAFCSLERLQKGKTSCRWGEGIIRILSPRKMWRPGCGLCVVT